MGAGGVIGRRRLTSTVCSRSEEIRHRFVVDEVICGFGRTGHMSGRRPHLQPDIMTLAKALSAGDVPISANLVPQTLRDLLAQSDKLGIFARLHLLVTPGPAAALHWKR